MSVQHTNLVQPATWVGSQNFSAVLARSAVPDRGQEHAYFACLALLFGYPIPLVAAVLMSEVRRGGLYSALAYLPVVIPPVVAVSSGRRSTTPTRTESSTRSSAGSASARTRGSSRSTAMPSLVLESTWANAGAR